MVWLLLLIVAVQFCVAEVPEIMSYQGVLYSQDGDALAPLAQASVRVRVDILPSRYADAEDDSLWSEELLLQSDDDGRFELKIGSSNDSESLADALTRVGDAGAWIQLTALDDSNVRPFQPVHLVSVPHAFAAARADRVVGGLTVDGDLTVHGTATLERIDIQHSGQDITVEEWPELDLDRIRVNDFSGVQTINAKDNGTSIKISNVVVDAQMTMQGDVRILGMDRSDLVTEEKYSWYKTKTDCFLWGRRAPDDSLDECIVFVSDNPACTNYLHIDELKTMTNVMTGFSFMPGDQYPVPVPRGSWFFLKYKHPPNGLSATCEIDVNTGFAAFNPYNAYFGTRLVPLGRVR